MSLLVTLNGQSYIIPETNEVGWGSNLDDFFVAIPAGVLQKTGGSFTLSAETDFGATYGLKSAYYKSRTANIASTGQLRLAHADSITFRNAANDGDLALTMTAGNHLQFNGVELAQGGTIDSGTQYQLGYYASNGTSISALTAITASRALASDANGLPVASATTAAELGYVAGLTSAVQTQLDSKLPLAGGTMTGPLTLANKTLTQRNAIGSPAAGMSIYDTTNSTVDIYDGAHWNSLQTPYNVKSYGATGNGSTDDLAAFVAALAAISTAKAELVIPTGTYVLSDNLTVPANVVVVFQAGAIVSPNTGKTLTINGPIIATSLKLFAGAGLIRGTFKDTAVRPEWWGAVGDGSTDDATAIQATVDFVHAAGSGTIVFSNKNYVIGTYITLYANMTLTGTDNSTITLKNGANTSMFYALSSTNITVKNLTFDGNMANNTSGSFPLLYGACLILTKCANTRVINNKFVNSYYCLGVYGLGADNAVITQNYFSNSVQGIDNYGFGQVITDNHLVNMTGAAISLEPTVTAGDNINEADRLDSDWLVADYSQALETSVHANTIRGAAYGIIVFDGVVGATITDNHIANITTVGIDAYHVHIKTLVITGNTVRNVTATNVDGFPWNATGAGIALGSGTMGAIISNNTTEYCWVGIYVNTQARCIVSNNLAQFNATSGICLFACTGTTVTGNVSYNNFLDRSTYANNSGIMVNAGSACTFSGNNTIDTNGYQVGGIFLTGTSLGHTFGVNSATGITNNPTANVGTTAVVDPATSTTYPVGSPLNFINGLRIGGLRHTAGSAAPGSGTWGTGSFVFNNNPSEAGSAGSKYVILGWSCISTGTPGTWLPCHCLTGN